MELQLEAIINSLDDAIVSVDESARVVFLNDAAARVFRCERHQVVGQPVALAPALADVVGQLNLKELPHSQSEKAVRRVHGRRSNGETFPMEAMVTSARVHGRNYYTAVIRDVSLQQRMQLALFQSRKSEAIGALASGIAHDFNNIFTAIISHLDLAIFARDLPSALKENLNYAKSSASRGAEWVSQLQAFSRLSKSQTAPLDLGSLIEQVVFIMRRSVDSCLEIQYAKPAARPWLVNADGNQILQVVINLCLNARDAMPAGGRLTMEVENVSYAEAQAQPPAKVGDFVRLVVRDTGEGMPPEVLQRLFEPYFTTKEVGQGVGLGLSIAYSVITEHGGWMEVDSQLGQGTEFHVFLPRSASAEGRTDKRQSL
ncbi:MAG TPA: ATP-binding protein, partial [Verrucomicrobiae bacterium]